MNVRGLRTYGDYLDYAEAKSKENLKTLLRRSYRRWCIKHRIHTMEPDALVRWRSESLADDEAGYLIRAVLSI